VWRAVPDFPGKLTNGTVFDSSVTRGQPFLFTIGVGQVIKGWDEGVIKMSLGEKVRAPAAITGFCLGEYGFAQAV
jgi:FK506-binding protein 1